MQYTLYIVAHISCTQICIKSNRLSWPCAYHEGTWEGGGVLVLILT